MSSSWNVILSWKFSRQDNSDSTSVDSTEIILYNNSANHYSTVYACLNKLRVTFKERIFSIFVSSLLRDFF